MRNEGNHILVVDDEAGIRSALTRLFEREGFHVESAEDLESALELIAKAEFDAAIVDIRLKGRDCGTDLIAELKRRDSAMPVILITGYGSVEAAVQAIKRGASDYILKPIDNAQLLSAVRKNLELARLRRDNDYLKSELLSKQYGHDLVAADPGFLEIVSLADRVKDSQAPVLLTGESGTGKEVMARYIHFSGSRGSGPFVGINCASLSESLLLSELFGHEKGSFTGAIEKQLGKFELAHSGTLFLDEIGDMSLQVQAKLLRVLEESSFERVGGTRRITVDVRLIAATNKDLGELIRRGEFRSDLLYRVNTVSIRLPPLRDRPGDIPLLADFFMKKYAAKYNRQSVSISGSLMSSYLAHDWPGNVRELQNAVNQAVLLSPGPVLDWMPGGAGARADEAPDESLPRRLDGCKSLKELDAAVLAHYERAMILRTLESRGWNRSRAAEALGVTRKTLAAKMTEYGIRPPKRESAPNTDP